MHRRHLTSDADHVGDSRIEGRRGTSRPGALIEIRGFKWFGAQWRQLDRGKARARCAG
jgi:hypothetical protein